MIQPLKVTMQSVSEITNRSYKDGIHHKSVRVTEYSLSQHMLSNPRPRHGGTNRKMYWYSSPPRLHREH